MNAKDEMTPIGALIITVLLCVGMLSIGIANSGSDIIIQDCTKGGEG